MQKMPQIGHKAALFFCFRRIASRIHEISDAKNALVLSLRAEYTRSRVQKKTLSTRGLDKTSLNHSVYVVLPSRRAEEFKEKYLKCRLH